ncbi:uncharacterized protein LOC125075821 isoform X2 [Vanessa atalanta]|uniref:uncharacterized protein LOC125075821 isoform X2 n=1 Tax=Vanessa atalanta TaxID=42275 RepID=UPI001FCD7EA0|nr:uncharacterized protein LOC125075821 isoform X2 [Vanessa atalanta]
MIDAEEYNETAVQPVDHQYAKATVVDNPTMDCQDEDEEELVGPFTGSPYDEDYEDDEEEEEPVEWTSPPPSPVPPLAFGIHGDFDDETYEEGNVSDLVYGLDNVAIDQSEAQTNNEVHYLGLYKFVYFLSKAEQESSDNIMQEAAATDQDTQ